MKDFGGAYADRRVLLTGETGFKGAWLGWWLHQLGARVEGLSLPPPTDPSLHAQAELTAVVPHHEVDVREAGPVRERVAALRPEVVFHLAAQSLVRESYADPVGTTATNVMGTLHVLDAVRAAGRPCAVVVVTSDKCYAGSAGSGGHGEGDPLGGEDPYGASKACAEIVAGAYRQGLLSPASLGEHGIAIATARAGNVLGPGDHARDRILPDCLRALAEGREIAVRHPDAVRPWQHVLEPLAGYLRLGSLLLSEEAATWCEAWNFGPRDESWQPVRALVEALLAVRGAGAWRHEADGGPPESSALRLDVAKATRRLGWRPVWSFEETVARTVRGYAALDDAKDADAVRGVLSAEIEAYRSDARAAGLGWASA